MTADVVDFTGATTLDINPYKMLETVSKEEGIDTLVIVYEAGDQIFYSSSTGDRPLIGYLLDRAKLALMKEFIVE